MSKKELSIKIDYLSIIFDNLTTSFDHKVYNDGRWNATSTTLDFIPVVGGLKGLIEGCVGKKMSGETLTANEKTKYKLMGVVSLGLDVFH